jgi:hypothetical protein
MTEDEQYVADHIALWVGSGFYSGAQIEAMMADIAADGCDLDALKALVAPALRRKRNDERNWPSVTDCDRLDQIFGELHESGICALANAGYTMADGHDDVAEALAASPPGHYRGYCFYHGQDVERAVRGQGLLIAFGHLRGDPLRSQRIGQAVAAALADAGFAIEWDGSSKQRIHLPALRWQRRAGGG